MERSGNEYMPVRVSLNVQGFGQSETVTDEIDRGSWNAMNPAEREKLLNQMAEDHAINWIGYGWHIDDPDDMATVDQH